MRPTDRDEAMMEGLQLGSLWGFYTESLSIIVPPEYRRGVEDEFRQQMLQSEPKYDLRLMADRDKVLGLFAQKAKGELARLVAAVRANRPRPTPHVRIPKRRGKPPRRERERERNARLLAFGAERVVRFSRLLDGNLKPGRLGREGIPWEKLHVEWLRAYPAPADWIPSREALRVEYYAAARSTHLAHEFLRQVKSEIDEEWEEQERVLTEIRKHFAGLSDADRAKLAAPFDADAWRASPGHQTARAHFENARKALRRLRATFSSLEEYQEWQAERDAEREEEYRASLTRKALIQERVRRLAWRVPGKDPEEEKQLRQSPLRDWFLPEARGGPMRLHSFLSRVGVRVTVESGVRSLAKVMADPILRAEAVRRAIRRRRAELAAERSAQTPPPKRQPRSRTKVKAAGRAKR